MSAPLPSHHRIAALRAAIDRATEALRGGAPVLVAEAGAEGACLLVFAGAGVRPEQINRLCAEAGGVIGCSVDAERAAELGLRELRARHTRPDVPRYAVSVEAACGVSTGISAADRAQTVAALCDPATAAADLVRPGHIMPALVDRLGTLGRPYAVEAAHDLVRLAGLPGGAAFSHVLAGIDEVRGDGAEAAARAHGWPLVWAQDVAALRAATEEYVEAVAGGAVATAHGTFQVEIYRSELDGTSHVAVACGEVAASGGAAPLVRLHSQCLTGDVLHSLRCDCGQQLDAALAAIAAEGRGVLLYLNQEGRGIGLVGKIRAYALQDAGRDTVDANLELGYAADQRDYAIAAQLLRRLGVARARLLTNNPDKVEALRRLGVVVEDCIGLEVPEGPHNAAYLRTKRERMGHALGLDAAGCRTH